ELAAIGILTV
nr:Chain C, Melanoma peptide [synthetic construct]4JFP_C Chain C, G4A heteroclitic Melanoma peptide [synthetic construct]4JFP_F Chain F, G4A heteroclitic Melanoma peptide [synthetic construct]